MYILRKVHFRHKEVDSQLNKKSKKSGGQGSVALLKNSKQCGCVFQDTEPPKSKSISRRSQNSKNRSATCSAQKVHYATKNRKNRVHLKVSISSLNVMSVAPTLQNLWTDLRKNILETRAMRPQRCVGNGKNVHKPIEKDRATFYSPSDV